MIAVIAGTNRPRSNTIKLASIVRDILIDHGKEVSLLDLAKLPTELLSGESYTTKPPEFDLFQDPISRAQGIICIVPEYNGSFPGVLKYFIDMLRFPDSLYEKPAAFVGISAGQWGAVRAVEHLEMVFQYRHAHLFGRRVFIPGIGNAVSDDGKFNNPDLEQRLVTMVQGFARFCKVLDSEENNSD